MHPFDHLNPAEREAISKHAFDLAIRQAMRTTHRNGLILGIVASFAAFAVALAINKIISN